MDARYTTLAKLFFLMTFAPKMKHKTLPATRENQKIHFDDTHNDLRRCHVIHRPHGETRQTSNVRC